jgi:hypothetical protein
LLAVAKRRLFGFLPDEHGTGAFISPLFTSATKKLRLFFVKSDNGSAHRGDRFCLAMPTLPGSPPIRGFPGFL